MTRPGCLDCPKFTNHVGGHHAKGVPLGVEAPLAVGGGGAGLAENKVYKHVSPHHPPLPHSKYVGQGAGLQAID